MTLGAMESREEPVVWLFSVELQAKGGGEASASHRLKKNAAANAAAAKMLPVLDLCWGAVER